MTTLSLTTSQIERAADDLFNAEKNRLQIDPISLTHPKMSMDDAYAIQAAWVAKKIAQGEKIIGYKIGLTSKAMQQAMNIDTPDYGVLLDSMAFNNKQTINSANFTDPRIEVELAFVLKKRLFGTEVTVEQVLEATDYVIPALELIAARSYRTHPDTGYIRNVMDTISDNAANAGIIVGDAHIKPEQMDLRWAGAILTLNNEVEATGLAAGVMGHPANGVCWVAKRFASHNIGLEAGQVILAGSFTKPVTVKPGDQLCADYGSLGEINICFK